MKIFIQNLKQGISSFSDSVKPEFLSREYALYYPSNLKVKAVVDRIEKQYLVKVTLETIAKYRCDRCLDDFEQEIFLEQEQIYRMGEIGIIDEDVKALPFDAVDIDLSPLLDEMIVLNHPIKMLCKEDCKGLCPNCGVNLNKEICCCSKDKTDPRWDQLRKLIK